MNKIEAKAILKAAQEMWGKKPNARSPDQTIRAASILVGHQLEKNRRCGIPGLVNTALNETLTIPTLRLKNAMSRRMNVDKLLEEGREIYRVINDCI